MRAMHSASNSSHKRPGNSSTRRPGNSSTRRPSTRVLLTVAVCALAAALIGWRIWAINQNHLTIPEEHYAMGEWVDLDGAFLYDNQENTKGYSLRITGAELMTAPEYIDRYGKDDDADDASPSSTEAVDAASNVSASGTTTAEVGPASTARGLSASGEYDDDESVLVLHYDVKNQGNDAGYIDMVTQWVMSDKKNRFYRCDYDLWQTAEPVMGEMPVMKLVKDSEHSTAVPFSNTQSRSLFANVNEEKRLQVTDESVHLVVSNAPVRKVIDIELPGNAQ